MKHKPNVFQSDRVSAQGHFAHYASDLQWIATVGYLQVRVLRDVNVAKNNLAVRVASWKQRETVNVGRRFRF